MATQFGEECWCSRLDDLDFDVHGAGQCDIYCTGDKVRSQAGWLAGWLDGFHYVYLCPRLSLSPSLSKPETYETRSFDAIAYVYTVFCMNADGRK